jgi:hypothetical protein
MNEPTPSHSVDMAQIKAAIDDSIQRLLEQRKWIIRDFTEKLKALDAERENLLRSNAANLKELGVKDSDIPAPPPLNLQLGSIRKLDDNQIITLLKEFMEPSVEYSSSVLLDYLLVSYMDFKKFVERNPSFIFGRGKNKGRYYLLKQIK